MRESRVIAHLAHRRVTGTALGVYVDSAMPQLYAFRETVFLVAGLELHLGYMPHTHAAKYDTDYCA